MIQTFLYHCFVFFWGGMTVTTMSNLPSVDAGGGMVHHIKPQSIELNFFPKKIHPNYPSRCSNLLFCLNKHLVKQCLGEFIFEFTSFYCCRGISKTLLDNGELFLQDQFHPHGNM